MTSQPVPRVVELGDAKPPRPVRRRAAELLAAGRVVALPTETVYGLGVRADDPDALERLRALKGSADRAWTWHVARRDAVAGFALEPVARRLAERYWPGPVTLVLRGERPGLEGIAQEGWTGLRLPAHRAALGLIEVLDFPLVLTSANRSGEPPLTDAAAVAAAFPEVELVVDGGACRLGESSVVLRVGPGVFDLLRPGLLDVEQLRATAGLRIAFCCTGNTCRSPMAEALARDLLARRLGADPARFGFVLGSMGIAAGPGAPASAHAVEVMAARGLDLSGHRSRSPRPEEIRGWHHVFGLTRSHVERLRELVSPADARRIVLLDPRGRDVPDPIGGSRADYEACAASLLEAIEARAAAWA